MIVQASKIENTINLSYLFDIFKTKINEHNTILTNFDVVRPEDVDLQDESYIKSLTRTTTATYGGEFEIKTPTRNLYVLIDSNYLMAKLIEETEDDFIPLLIAVPESHQDDFEVKFVEATINYIKEHFAS